jgi:hypothetical protein
MNIEPASVPTAIAPALSSYLARMTAHAPGLLQAFYLIGSIALDAFQEGRSDVDFVAVLGRQAAVADLALLRDAHRQFSRACPCCPMDGSYWQLNDLRRQPLQAVPGLCYHDGQLRHTRDLTLSPVDCWLLARRGVVLLGSPPPTLGLPIDWDAVSSYMLTNLNTYWLSFTCAPSRLARLLTDQGVEWAVLGISRLWYALCAGEIPSKLRAGEYVFEQALPQWRTILAEGLAIRRQQPSSYRSRLARARDTVEFIKYVIQECNSRHTPPPGRVFHRTA